jgi:cytosine/adenosine deaminase-related metal-dependent hydrolase
MFCVSGMIYLDGDFVEGFVEVEDGCNRLGHGLEKDADLSGVVIPRPVNMHTHLGDAFISRPEKASVEEIVAPPDGLKHRLLAEVGEEKQVEAMRSCIARMAAGGTCSFVDFREGGVEGVHRLLSASIGADIWPVVFGRPLGLCHDPKELECLLRLVDGIGISSISDWGPDSLEGLKTDAQKAGKPLAMHASETRRENIESILGMKPAFLVHMIKATREDLDRVAEDDVPVVVCPSANSFFGLRAPVEEMLEAGITVCLGTDNAMLAGPDILEETRALRGLATHEITDRDILEIALHNSRKVYNSDLCLGAATGEYPDFLVLDVPSDNPYAAVLRAKDEDVSHIQRLRREW